MFWSSYAVGGWAINACGECRRGARKDGEGESTSAWIRRSCLSAHPSTHNEGKKHFGWSWPAKPAFIEPEPLSMTTGWLTRTSWRVNRVSVVVSVRVCDPIRTSNSLWICFEVSLECRVYRTSMCSHKRTRASFPAGSREGLGHQDIMSILPSRALVREGVDVAVGVQSRCVASVYQRLQLASVPTGSAATRQQQGVRLLSIHAQHDALDAVQVSPPRSLVSAPRRLLARCMDGLRLVQITLLSATPLTHSYRRLHPLRCHSQA